MGSNLIDSEKSEEAKLHRGSLVIWNWFGVVLEIDFFLVIYIVAVLTYTINMLLGNFMQMINSS